MLFPGGGKLTFFSESLGLKAASIANIIKKVLARKNKLYKEVSTTLCLS